MSFSRTASKNCAPRAPGLAWAKLTRSARLLKRRTWSARISVGETERSRARSLHRSRTRREEVPRLV
eukprot:4657676-Lingulodinium_polyedra.AAC.1